MSTTWFITKNNVKHITDSKQQYILNYKLFSSATHLITTIARLNMFTDLLKNVNLHQYYCDAHWICLREYDTETHKQKRPSSLKLKNNKKNPPKKPKQHAHFLFLKMEV